MDYLNKLSIPFNVKLLSFKNYNPFSVDCNCNCVCDCDDCGDCICDCF